MTYIYPQSIKKGVEEFIKVSIKKIKNTYMSKLGKKYEDIAKVRTNLNKI